MRKANSQLDILSPNWKNEVNLDQNLDYAEEMDSNIFFFIF